MSDPIKFTPDGRVALSTSEIKVLQSLINAHDRGGFYMAYNAMTDSNEAGLQSKISTFSDPTGGAALAANRLAQVETGGLPTYPGMYNLSEKIAQSALDFIKANTDEGGSGSINDDTFFKSAEAAWKAEHVVEYFPGNALYAPSLAADFVTAFVLSLSVYNGRVDPYTIDEVRQSVKQLILDGSHVATPGAFNSALAAFIAQNLGKTDAEMLAAGYSKVDGPNGFSIFVAADGTHVGATLNHDLSHDTTIEISSALISSAVNIAVIASLPELAIFLSLAGTTMSEIIRDAITDIVFPPTYGPVTPANFSEFVTNGSSAFNGDTQAEAVPGDPNPDHAAWHTAATDGADILFSNSGALDGGSGDDVLFGGTGVNGGDKLCQKAA